MCFFLHIPKHPARLPLPSPHQMSILEQETLSQYPNATVGDNTSPTESHSSRLVVGANLLHRIPLFGLLLTKYHQTLNITLAESPTALAEAGVPILQNPCSAIPTPSLTCQKTLSPQCSKPVLGFPDGSVVKNSPVHRGDRSS